MKPFFALIMLCGVFLFFSCATEKEFSPIKSSSFLNRDPIILLHGLNGFGRDEYDNFFYWGGSLDLESELRAAGYEVRTANVGPLSSNWDRSCEFYACLKGGRVDYGEEHSREAGHDRFGRVYEGIYPQWGTVNEETGELRKIHILAHSMGGVTARMTAQLLNEGNQKEKNVPHSSPFFQGNKDWIKSITTLSTPHDGTTLTYEFTSYRQRDLITYLALGFMVEWDKNFFVHNDLQLDHWSFINQKSHESESEYRERLSSIIGKWEWNNKDFSDYDLSPEGAWEINGWVKTLPQIYYLSWETRITEEKENNTLSIHPAITPLLIPFSHVLMSYKRYRSSMINIDSLWLPNDGVVNCLSQDGPKLNSSSSIVPYKDVVIRGVWNYMGELFPLDHMQVLGWNHSLFKPQRFKDIIKWYEDQAALLTSLP